MSEIQTSTTTLPSITFSDAILKMMHSYEIL